MTPRAQRAVEMAAIGGFEACHAYTGTGEGAQRWTWEMLPEGDGREYWRKVARAALIAALEDLLASKDEFPTDAMLNAAQSRLCELAHVTHFNDWHQAEMLRAMLSTLLSDLKGA
jgi:hypothetical protein